ncbi:MAG: DUF1549 domain-containing protein, partial [Acidobacteria bacterium]|nr:DUF1549 domain-containing protein [Acidobacteriota bacterium]
MSAFPTTQHARSILEPDPGFRSRSGFCGVGLEPALDTRREIKDVRLRHRIGTLRVLEHRAHLHQFEPCQRGQIRIGLGLDQRPTQVVDVSALQVAPIQVDRLLGSPHYGERWGRHWMDVWRYSDWYGYRKELRNSARHIWRWRDWIIESLNDDAPYDQMLRDMLAADEIAPGDADRLRATGFLARNYYKFNRNTWLDATIEHTGKAFLGLTLNCARCHDHMYDPIAQSDYYRFRAIFEPH